jgi:hypothetical protein
MKLLEFRKAAAGRCAHQPVLAGAGQLHHGVGQGRRRAPHQLPRLQVDAFAEGRADRRRQQTQLRDDRARGAGQRHPRGVAHHPALRRARGPNLAGRRPEQPAGRLHGGAGHDSRGEEETQGRDRDVEGETGRGKVIELTI